MAVAVADTHALYWYLFNDPRLSDRVRSFIEIAATRGEQIAVSAVSLVEIVYLIEKGRFPSTLFTRLTASFLSERALFVEIPLDVAIARTVSRIPYTQVPDMPDRIIAATALYLDVPIISRDGKIQLNTLTTIW